MASVQIPDDVMAHVRDAGADRVGLAGVVVGGDAFVFVMNEPALRVIVTGLCVAAGMPVPEGAQGPDERAAYEHVARAFIESVNIDARALSPRGFFAEQKDVRGIVS